VEQRSAFPFKGEATLTLRMARPARFALKLRAPAWAQPLLLEGATLQAGWAELPARQWQDGDQLRLGYRLASRVLTGETTHAGRAALAWGPFVLAYEQQANPELPPPRKLGLAQGVTARASAVGPALRFEADVDSPLAESTAARMRPAKFVSFADADADHGPYRVWLRAPGVTLAPPKQADSVLAGGEESRSRSGNVPGSIIDDDLNNLVNTWNGQYAAEDWFAVTLDQPVSASRFVFTHGRNYHDGGWFDTEAGKPKVQVQRSADGPWEAVGELQSYPATTAASAPGLVQGQQFALRLDAPLRFVAVRVIGKPASGDRPQQAFVTCTELQAF
jgi:hypothetical protein